MQRAVGNCVVGRILARKTKAPSRQTGLRADAMVREYVTNAVAFRARNANVPARPADATAMRRLGPTSVRAAKPLPAQLPHRQSTDVC